MKQNNHQLVNKPLSHHRLWWLYQIIYFSIIAINPVLGTNLFLYVVKASENQYFTTVSKLGFPN